MQRRVRPPGVFSITASIVLLCCGVILLVGGILARFSFEFPYCTNEMLEALPSKDGKYRAVAFRRNCGPQNRISSNLSVLKTGQSLKGAGNLLEINGDVSLEFRWIANDRIQLIRPPAGFISKRHREIVLAIQP